MRKMQVSALLAGVCALLCVLVCMMPISARATEASSEEQEANADGHHETNVLVILTDSLTWRNINSQSTPVAAQWAAAGTMFNVVPPNINGWDCPQDGALSMSAGTVARAYTTGSSPACSLSSMTAGYALPGWDSLLEGEVENLLATTERLYPEKNFRQSTSSDEDSKAENDVELTPLPDYVFTTDQEVLALEAKRLETELPPLGAFGELLGINTIDYAAIGPAAGALTINSEGIVPEQWVSAEKENVRLVMQVKNALQSKPVVFVDTSSTNFGADAARAEAIYMKSIKMPPALPTDSEPDMETSTPNDIFLKGYREAQGDANAKRINDVLKEVDPGTLVLVASMQGMGATSELGPGFISYGMSDTSSASGTACEDSSLRSNESSTDDLLGCAGLGWSSQVRQIGSVSYLSIIPTLMQVLEMKVPEGFYGGIYSDAKDLYASPMKAVQSDSSLDAREDHLAHMKDKASAIRSSRTPFYRVMRGAAISFIVISTLVLMWMLSSRLPQFTNVKSRKSEASRVAVVLQRCLSHVQRAFDVSHRPDGLPARWSLIVRWVLIVGGLTVSAVPLSSHIVTMLIPWWQALSPTYALVGATWLCAGVIGALSIFLFRWHPYAPIVALSTTTAIMLLADVATGSRVLADSPMGFNTLMGSRFYGMGNEAFALVAVGSLMGISGVCSLMLRAGYARWLVAVCAGLLGLCVTVIDVWPSMGADFGGALSFVPALAVLVVLVSRVRVTAKRVAAVCALGVLAAGGAAIADWLRPEQSRTHLGNFVQSIIDGEAWEIIARKIAVNIHLLQISAHRWVVASGLLFIMCVLVPLLRRRYGSVRESMMLTGMVSVAVALLLGCALNDSGITLPGMGFILAIPGMIAAVAYHWDGQRVDYVGAVKRGWERTKTGYLRMRSGHTC